MSGFPAPFTGLAAQRFRPAVYGGLASDNNLLLSPVYGASRGSASAILSRAIQEYYSDCMRTIG